MHSRIPRTSLRWLGPSHRTFSAYRGVRIFSQGIRAQIATYSHGQKCLRTYSTEASEPAPVTKIEKILLDNIKVAGPVTFASYMQFCLSYPTEGYYMKPSNHIFGTQGDFITSPEISQVFGELLATWLQFQYFRYGNNLPIRVLELGPGRGTLMEDILRTLSQFAKGTPAIKEVCLVETSPPLRSIQERKLAPVLEKLGGIRANWLGSIEDLQNDDEDYFTMVVAHEFFDALPFHMIEKTEQGWDELLISSASDPSRNSFNEEPVHPPASPFSSAAEVENQSASSHRFRSVRTSTPMATLLGSSSPRFAKLPVGSRIEVSSAGQKIARRIAKLIGDGHNKSRGCALIVDYGQDWAAGNTFRAFKNHKIVDPFYRPSECDLTVNVDFAYLKEALVGMATPLGPIPQASFLTRMGLKNRIEALARHATNEDRRSAIRLAADRLIDLNAMGKQYQVLGVIGGYGQEMSSDEAYPFV